MSSTRAIFLLVLLYLLSVDACFGEEAVSAGSAHMLVLTAEEQAWIDAHPVIRVASGPDYAPFQFRNDAGKSVGVANDYQ